MAKAKKLPSGMWRVQASVNGERRSFTDYTAKGAELMALEWQTGKKNHNAKGMTVGEAAERYIKNRSAVLSPKTVSAQWSIFRNLPDEITEMCIADIKTDIVQGWINDLAKIKAPKTVKNYYGFFSAVAHAYDDDYHAKIHLPQKVKTEIYIPTHKEVSHLLSVYRDSDPEMFTATQLASVWGMRRGEICALENKKKNFSIRKIDIHQAFVMDCNSKKVLKQTKSYSGNRILTAPQFVADTLLDIPHDWEYVIKTSLNSITNRFTRTIKKEFDNQFSFHDLRHYYASVLIAEGVPERYAMYLMGHSSPNMLRNVYGHIMADKEDEISIHINSVFSDRLSVHTKMHMDK